MTSNERVLAMKITITDRGGMLRNRLRERFNSVAALLCAEHGQSPVALTIDDREHGWFDARWVTCCEALERRAAGIIKNRC